MWLLTCPTFSGELWRVLSCIGTNTIILCGYNLKSYVLTLIQILALINNTFYTLGLLLQKSPDVEQRVWSLCSYWFCWWLPPVHFKTYNTIRRNSSSESESHLVVSNSLRPHGILQARILAWIAFTFSRGSSWPRNWPGVSRIAGGFPTIWATREAHEY